MMKNKKVYVVEDNPDIRELISYILTNDLYQVMMCDTAAAFDEKIQSNLPDLVVLDIMLPDGDGLEICKRLKTTSETAHIPVLLMSANNNRKEVIQEACAEDFISKPFDIDEFVHKVELYL